MQKFKTAHPYKKRGIIYISIAFLFIGYELLMVKPMRSTVLLLWSGVIVISLLVMTQLKDPRH
ncbi:MAG: hypothetical protein EHM72_20360 [Calditrichaeota bacterium]|nr:MAG: hypothetical protein EHM72_20360 [Calditrichota bacterium]